MRNLVATRIMAVMFVVAAPALSSTAMAQERERPPVAPGFVKAGVPKMPNPPGPAPKRELTGAWIGPQNKTSDPVPPMTPAGEARFNLNKPKSGSQPWSGNDPFRVCDPLGFPRNLSAVAVSSRGEMWFEPVADRMVILYGQQRVWRDVWMDGRQLPAKVDAKGAPDSRFYGYSVGHWEDDYTFVVDTTGLDERTWLDEAGHPHSAEAHVQERYTRVDQYNIQLTATIDDPKIYTKPWQVIKANYYWIKNQDFDETFCVPSDAIEYLNNVINPSGNEGGVK
jgi:hypothetical protein